jgi:DNA polymerase-3 subunit delta'
MNGDDTLEPRANPELLGQEAAERAFLQAWRSGRLAHAWLLTGPRGIGKATLAFRIARFALAGGVQAPAGLFGEPEPASLQMPTDHSVFRRVASGGHADFRLVERGWADDKHSRRKSDITVDEVRDIGGFLALTPAEAGWRVVIVDSADEMNRSSANAILKILEEPPKRALLLLVSHSPGRLLPTIRSRCRRLALPPLANPLVAGLLRKHRPDLAEDEAKGLAALSGGSIGRALALHRQGGLALYGEMVGLLERLPQLPVTALHDFSDRIGRQSDHVALFGELWTSWLADAAASAAGGPSRTVLAGEAELQQRLVARTGLERWSVLWEKTGALFERADAVNLDGKQVVLQAFLSLEKLCR